MTKCAGRLSVFSTTAVGEEQLASKTQQAKSAQSTIGRRGNEVGAKRSGATPLSQQGMTAVSSLLPE